MTPSLDQIISMPSTSRAHETHVKSRKAPKTEKSEEFKETEENLVLENLQNIENSERFDRYQIKIAMTIDCIIFSLSKFFPVLEKFYKLQYKYPGTQVYDIGYDDIYFGLFAIVNLCLVRSGLMIFVLKPLARSFKVIELKPIQRFKEQGWSLIYYSTSWGLGFYLYYHSTYFFNCDAIYQNWPHDRLTFLFKLYYLIQTSCWLQQIMVLNIEERRKDYYQMFSHHIITSLLCTGSYSHYFTHIGHVILLIMDGVDVFLALAKMLKYCGFQKLCDIMFIVFMMCWIVLRHGVYNYVFIHACKNACSGMNGVCADYIARGEPYKLCYSKGLIDFLLWLLGGLQILTIIWFFLILKVAFRVIKGASADDVRSDGEDED